MLSIVAGLSDADMIWLLSVGKLRGMRAGERLVEAGRTPDALFFVTSGALEVLLPDGTRIARLSEGEVIGEMSFLNSLPPTVSVRAEGKVEVLAVARGEILARFEREPVFAARFYRALATFLAARLRETTARRGAYDMEAPETIERTGERFRGLVGRFRGRAG